MTKVTGQQLPQVAAGLLVNLVMPNEPTLLFKLSRPQTFRCSACSTEYRGDIDAEGWVIDVIDVFRDHVRRYHSKRFVKETKGKA
jgi:hypothetical protein